MPYGLRRARDRSVRRMPQRAGEIDTVAIGRIGGAKGIGGGVRVTSYSGEYEHFLVLDEVELVPTDDDTGRGAQNPGGTTSLSHQRMPYPMPAPGTPVSGRFARDAARLRAAKDRSPGRIKVHVTGVEAGPGGLVLHFKGYESPESVRSLTGMDIVVPAAKAAPLKPGEFYVRDLVGMKLLSGGVSVAIIDGVFDGAADPCLEIALPAGRKVLVPFRKEFIGEIDLETRTAELIAPWILEE